MRAVVQRVKNASVTVEGSTTGQIESGLLVYLGVSDDDTEETCSKMARKVAMMRIFVDDQDKMNLSVSDVGGQILVVSQFTLYADVKKGNRPSYSGAGKPEHANRLYEVFVSDLRDMGFVVGTGRFGAHMHVCYENDGPITIVMDSDQLFPESKK